MAADNGDLTALVFNEEVPESTYIREEKDTEYDSTVEVLPENRSYVSGTADKEQQQHFITAVFVVSFDTRKGNIIEWKYPESVQLSGVEFKALASGSHNVFQDFVYFKHGDNQFGLSCYQRISVENEDERGARMKSVGIICSKYTSLHEHMEFLEDQVRTQLENPGSYSKLVNYFEEFRVCKHKNNWLHSLDIPGVVDLPFLKITHPAGCFSQFLNFFGAKIFVIWKLVLLHRRILFFSPPPVGISCYRVYCACLLGSHSTPLSFETGSNPLFFTNIFDIPQLDKEHKYIACTTEKIFESKSDLYDVYVNNQNIKCKPYLSAIQYINTFDKDRYNRLLDYRSNQLHSGGECVDDEKMYTRFFADLNNSLFQALDAASKSDKKLSADVIRRIGLDPKNDRTFLTLLIDLYGVKVPLEDKSCCGIM